MRDDPRAQSASPEPIDDEEIIDLGDWEPLAAAPKPHDGQKVEDTRASLAFFLLWILAGTIAVLFMLLGLSVVTAEEFTTIGGFLVAPLVGLVGSATGYYYGRGSR